MKGFDELFEEVVNEAAALGDDKAYMAELKKDKLYGTKTPGLDVDASINDCFLAIKKHKSKIEELKNEIEKLLK